MAVGSTSPSVGTVRQGLGELRAAHTLKSEGRRSQELIEHSLATCGPQDTLGIWQ